MANGFELPTKFVDCFYVKALDGGVRLNFGNFMPPIAENVAHGVIYHESVTLPREYAKQMAEFILKYLAETEPKPPNRKERRLAKVKS